MKQTQSNRGWNIVAGIILGLLILAEGVLLFLLARLNMLPWLYFGILAGICVLFTIAIGLMLRRRKSGKWQKTPGYGKQVFAVILTVLIVALCTVGIMALSQLQSTISSITTTTKINVLLEVYVLADDPAEYIQDTGAYTFALADTTETEDADKAVDALEELLGTQLSVVSYSTSFEMIDALYAGEVDAVILDSSYLSIMDTMDVYADFTNRAKVLHEYVIEKEIVVEKIPDSEKKDANEPFLVYISGNDARRELLADGGSDVNILVAVNPEARQILLVNTPRDYYVSNPAGNGAKDKLSHCGLNGIQNCIGAISDLYGLEIDYYARINFTGFKTLGNSR